VFYRLTILYIIVIMSDEKYKWFGVYMKWTERYGWGLTKEPHVHTPLQNEAQEDSTADNQPTPPLEDSNSTV